MTIRTTRSQVTSKAPFLLAEIDGHLPAGTYDIDTDEEIIEGMQRTAYLRVGTLLYLRHCGTMQVVTVDPVGWKRLWRSTSI